MKALSPSLVPFLKKEQFDDIAEEFLQEFYPEALMTPMALPVEEVVSRMNLHIQEMSLSHNLVDPDVFFERNLGCWNNTVIHECVHWYKHRKHFELMRLMDEDYTQIACRVHESECVQDVWHDEDWMEWQANGIAPRILMPNEMTLQKISEIREVYLSAVPNATKMDIADHTIRELAHFFGVSLQSAKIRMLDLGFSDAEPLFNYLDDHYIDAYSYKEGSLGSEQTFNISQSDSVREYTTNQGFQDYVGTGNFIYVDGHFTIDDPSYVDRSPKGSISLTDYAKSNLDECCIRFELAATTWKSNNDEYQKTSLFREAVSGHKRAPVFGDDEYNQELLERAEELQKFSEDTDECAAFMAKTANSNFSETIAAHIERLHLNSVTFYEKTLLDDRQFRKLKSGKPIKVNFDTVMAICVGLGLGLLYGEPLLEKAGHSLNNQERLPYKMLLVCYRGHTIFECNELLIGKGVKPIRETAYRKFLE